MFFHRFASSLRSVGKKGHSPARGLRRKQFRQFYSELLEPRLVLDNSPSLSGVWPLPAEGQMVSTTVDRLQVTLSESLQAGGVNDTASWQLLGSGPDQQFSTADDLVYALAVRPASAGGTTVTLEIGDRLRPLPEGRYQFRARSASLLDTDGNRLDGNDDGVGGDDFVRTFLIETPTGVTIEAASNDTRVQAVPLEIVSSPPTSGNQFGFGLGTLPLSTDVDYWRFDVLGGDRISVAVDTMDGSLRPRIELRNAADSTLISDIDGGPDNSALISDYAVSTSGIVYVRISPHTSTGSYQLRVNVARGIDLESDREYRNSTNNQADLITLRPGAPDHLVGSVAGVIMAPANTTWDRDRFALGRLNGNTVVELELQLPALSQLGAHVRLLDAAGNALPDEDGNLADGRLRLTLPTNADGEYFVEVNGHWIRQGRRYMVTDPLTWSQAQALARAWGGHLVTLNDAAEQQWVDDTFDQFGDFWIGFQDANTEGTWEWVSGQPVTYTNWASGEPNTASFDYAYMDDANGQWRDASETTTYRAVIEMDAFGLADATPGPFAQYLLQVDLVDTQAPRVTAVTRPAYAGSNSQPVDRFSVTFSEPLDPSTVNQSETFVGYHQGHYYVVTDQSLTWEQARTYAQNLAPEAHLVTIDDAAEQDYLQDWFSAFEPWIGFNDATVEGTWAWSNGQPVTYTNWAANQPSRGASSNDYAMMGTDGLWRERSSSESRRALIELPGGIDQDADRLPVPFDLYPTNPWNAWSLYEAGTDRVWGTVDDVRYTPILMSPYSQGTTVELGVLDGPLGTGRYRLTAGNVLRDRVGQALDGNQDGFGGDPFHYEFEIQLPADVTFEGRANTTRVAATDLTFQETPEGSGFFLARGLGTQFPARLYDYWSDSDYWSFSAQAGDRVAIAVETPGSDLNPYLELQNAQGSFLQAGNNRGPDQDDYISHYLIPSTGIYYVRVGKEYSQTSGGSYELRLELARQIELESDESYDNNVITRADTITLRPGAPGELTAVVAGTVMAPEGTTADQDMFLLGTLTAGNRVELQVNRPSNSTLVPRLRLLNARGEPVLDEDGDPFNEIFHATIPVGGDGVYFAELGSFWMLAGNRYLVSPPLTRAESRDWAAANGGQLVTIEDSAEQQWITETFRSFGNFWIGASDEVSEGTWGWPTGDNAIYTNWAPGEPNTPSYDYAFMQTSTGLWFDTYPTNTFRALVECEGPGTATGGPGSYAQYLLQVRIQDQLAPIVTQIVPSVGNNPSALPIDTLTITFNEDLAPQTVNQTHPWLGFYEGSYYLLTPTSMTWSAAQAYAQSLAPTANLVLKQANFSYILSS